MRDGVREGERGKSLDCISHAIRDKLSYEEFRRGKRDNYL